MALFLLVDVPFQWTQMLALQLSMKLCHVQWWIWSFSNNVNNILIIIIRFYTNTYTHTNTNATHTCSFIRIYLWLGEYLRNDAPAIIHMFLFEWNFRQVFLLLLRPIESFMLLVPKFFFFFFCNTINSNATFCVTGVTMCLLKQMKCLTFEWV